MRRWNCRNCGRSNKTVIAPDGTVKCEYCTDVTNSQRQTGLGRSDHKGQAAFSEPEPASRKKTPSDVDLVDDAKKRLAFVRLRDLYSEARELVSPREPYANLEWILGARNPEQDQVDLGDKTIDLIVLWLQDLAAEVDRLLPTHLASEIDVGAGAGPQARRSVARSLREATEGFVAAYRPSC